MGIACEREKKSEMERELERKKSAKTFMPVSYFIYVYMSVLRDDAFVGIFTKTFYKLALSVSGLLCHSCGVCSPSISLCFRLALIHGIQFLP